MTRQKPPHYKKPLIAFSNKSREAGFSLIEVVAAMVVLLIALLGVFTVFTYSVNYNAGDLAAGFLPPKYNLTGGFLSNIVYNASNVLFGSNRINTVVVGVAEK